MDESGEKGMVQVRSRHSVPETVARLDALLTAKGISILAQIDHSGDARRAGLSLRPTQLVIFGNPKAGTPLMVAAPGVAIDLPLKALIWQDDEGAVWVSYNSPEYLQKRHGLPEELIRNIAGIGSLCDEAAN